MNLFNKIDYSNPINFKRIERENAFIYRNLVNIYTRKPRLNDTLSKEHIYQQTEFQKRKCSIKQAQMQKIHNENMHLFVRLIQVKPTDGLNLKSCSNHWNNFLLYKSRRFASRKVRIISSY
jgi:hypothetical protein